MTKRQGMLPVLKKLARDSTAARNFRIARLNQSSLYLSFEENIVLMIQVADAYAENDHEPAHFQTNSCFRHARALLDEINLCCLEQYKKKSPTIANFFLPRFNKPKPSHLIMSVLITTAHSVDYDACAKSKRWETKTEMWEKRLFPMVE